MGGRARGFRPLYNPRNSAAISAVFPPGALAIALPRRAWSRIAFFAVPPESGIGRGRAVCRGPAGQLSFYRFIVYWYNRFVHWILVFRDAGRSGMRRVGCARGCLLAVSCALLVSATAAAEVAQAEGYRELSRRILDSGGQTVRLVLRGIRGGREGEIRRPGSGPGDGGGRPFSRVSALS